MNTFASVTRNKEIGELEQVKDNVREFKEVTIHLAAATPKLTGMMSGDFETAELAFSQEKIDELLLRP